MKLISDKLVNRNQFPIGRFNMVMSNDILDALKGIGMNLYERKIYVALLAKGIATAGEVSGIAKVPRSRSYDILESLADKGFVVLQPSKPIKYVALEPKDALERVKHNLEKKHLETQERIDKLAASPILEQLETVYKEGLSLVQPFEMTGTIKGKDAVNQHMRAIFKKAKSKITIVTTKNGHADLHSTHYNVLKKLSKKGVKIKLYAPLEKDSPIWEGVAEVKHIEQPAGRLYTIDDEHVMMALTDGDKTHDTQDILFWAQSPHVVKEVMEPFINQIGAKK